MTRRFIPALWALLTLVLFSARASASVDQFFGYQQTWHATDVASLSAQSGVHPGQTAWVDSVSKRYTCVPSGSYVGSSPDVLSGQNSTQWVSDYTVDASFVTSMLTWSAISGKPTTANGWLTDVAFSATAVNAGNGITVNGGNSSTLASALTFALTYGSSANTVCQGNDSRLSDARAPTAHASTHISTGSDPIPGAVASGASGLLTGADKAKLDAIASGADNTPDATSGVKGKVQLAGDLCAGTAASPSVCKAQGNTLPSGSLTTGWVMQASGAAAWSGGFVTNANVGTSAAIDPSKFAVCSANQVIASNGTVDACTTMTDAIHGSRGNGTLHSLLDATHNGFMPMAGATANRLPVTDGAGNVTWTTVPSAALTSVPWGSLYNLPTITTTAPLTGGGTLGNLTLAVNAATNATSGVVPSISGGNVVVMSKNGTSLTTDGIADAQVLSTAAISPSKLAAGGTANRVVATSDGTTVSMQQVSNSMISGVDWSKLSSVPANIDTGTGTSGTLAKWTGTSTLGNSSYLTEGSGLVTDSVIFRATGEIQTTSWNSWRSVVGNYGTFWRLDGTSLALRATASGDQYGSWSSFLPFLFDVTNGDTKLADTLTARNSNNRVGINTTTPATALDVNGVATIRGGSPAVGAVFMCIDTNGTGAWTSLASANIATTVGNEHLETATNGTHREFKYSYRESCVLGGGNPVFCERTITGSHWGGVGALNASVDYALADVRFRAIVVNTAQTGAVTREYAYTLRKSRATNLWAEADDGVTLLHEYGHLSGCTMNPSLSLGGTENADITLRITANASTGADAEFIVEIDSGGYFSS